MDEKELKYFIFASIISADNDEYTEETKQAIIQRFDSSKDIDSIDWKYVLEPLGEDAEKYAKFMRK